MIGIDGLQGRYGHIAVVKFTVIVVFDNVTVGLNGPVENFHTFFYRQDRAQGILMGRGDIKKGICMLVQRGRINPGLSGRDGVDRKIFLLKYIPYCRVPGVFQDKGVMGRREEGGEEKQGIIMTGRENYLIGSGYNAAGAMEHVGDGFPEMKASCGRFIRDTVPLFHVVPSS